jgi:hypothetical protein
LGGIETPRVLLANNHQIAEGIGNRYRLVGKHFQDHPAIRIGILHSKDPSRVIRLFGPNWHDGRLYTGKISLTSAKQRELATLNATAFCDGESYPRVLEKRMLLNLLRRKVLKDRIPAAIFNNLFQLLVRSLSLAVQRRIIRQDAQFAFTIMTEQEPFADSAISLGKTRDRYGVPRANIHWRLTENTWRTVMCFARLLKEEFESTNSASWSSYPI